jgi:HEAT repeat protein
MADLAKALIRTSIIVLIAKVLLSLETTALCAEPRDISNPSVRQTASGILGAPGDRRTVDSLIKAFEDPDSEVREAAVVALGEIDDARAVDPLIKLSGDKISEVREAASKALERLDEPLG